MLGEVPEGWNYKKIGQVTEIITRGIAPRYTESGGTIVLNQKCIRGNVVKFEFARNHNSIEKPVRSDKFLLDGDVLINSTGQGTLGRVSQFFNPNDRRITVDSHVTIVRPKQSVFINEFFGYACFYLEEGFEAEGSGSSGQTELSRASISEKFEIPIPPLPEQQRIAEILSSVDESIRATEAVIAQAEWVKRGLMEDLLTGGLGSAAIANGDVPEGWKLCDLKSALSKVIDYRGKAPPKALEGVPLITARNVRKGYLSFEHQEFIDAAAYGGWMNRGLPKSGDVMFTTEAPLGNVALFPEGERFALGQRIITLQCKEWLESIYLFYFLLSPFADKQISERATGTTAKGIKSKEFVKIAIPIPPVFEQRRIASVLRSIDESIESNQKALQRFSEVKRGLMDDLLTGRVRTIA